MAVSSRHVVQLDQGDAGRESWSGRAGSDGSDQSWELGWGRGMGTQVGEQSREMLEPVHVSENCSSWEYRNK